MSELNAIERSLAVIKFDLNGIILDANPNFLSLMGYSLEEIRGKHHKIFVSPEESQSQNYRKFWEKLNRGEFDLGEFKRYKKGGQQVWLEAGYCPLLDDKGKPYQMVKYAFDVTKKKMQTADFEGQINAISRSRALIQFDLKGNIVTANQVFLTLMGYKPDEVVGKHHSMFVPREEA